MNDTQIKELPAIYPALLEKCTEIGFSMPSDLYIGTLLKTLIRSKPGGRFLELGTGISLSLAWMIDGLDDKGYLISIDNDADLIQIAEDFFGQEECLELICADGGPWLEQYEGPLFDLIFADAWPGKFWNLEDALNLIRPGGFYVIDDLNPADDWPKGHQEKVNDIISYLENRNDLTLTKMNWSTGIIIATKH